MTGTGQSLREARREDARREAHWSEAHPSEEETAKQRLDRNFAELLQGLRVTQTGVQILLGLLLTMVFSSRFTELADWELALYAVAVGLTTLAMALLVALDVIAGVVIGCITLLSLALIWYGLPVVIVLTHQGDNVEDEP